MLQNMWHQLVDSVDDRSAKGIALALSTGIDRGLLRPGEQLPPIRHAARDLEVAPATVSAAWSRLPRARAIETHPPPRPPGGARAGGARPPPAPPRAAGPPGAA